MATAIAAACSSLMAMSAFAQARVDVSGLQTGNSYGRFIVKYRDGSAEATNAAERTRALAAAAARSPRGASVGLSQLRRTALGADVVITRSKLDRVEAEALMRQIAADANVEYVEVDQLNRAYATPNDPYYSQLWGFSGTYGIRANTAWDVTLGAGSVVAVLDTGITNHSDLNANVLPGYDFISDLPMANDGDGRDANPADPGDWVAANACGSPHDAETSSWHGTHVAGTIAAVINNARGVAGVAPAAKIVPVRVLGKCGGWTTDIADAIVWASGGSVAGVPANANPAEVINLSLGGTGACSATYQNAINSAVGRGTTVIVSAGNENRDAVNNRPANCNNVIAVAATTNAGVRASSFSNYGALIDIAAPGQSIISTYNTGTTTPGAETYMGMGGTSMAAPHVAGVVALMQAVSSTPKTPAQIEAILKSTATPFASPQSPAIGAGIVNARSAVDAVRPITPPPPPPAAGTLTKAVAVTGLSGAAGAELRYTFTVPAGATNLTFKLSGGTGDADMHVKFGSAPSTTVYDCRPWVSGNNETCTFAAPQAGTYYVLVKGYSAFSGASLVADYVPNAASTGLIKGVPFPNLSAAAGSQLKFALPVPAGASNLSLRMSGGTGDADMYVKFGGEPTTTSYDCRPYLTGNNETCTIAAPRDGVYYVVLKARSAFSGVSLVADYSVTSGTTYSNNIRYNIADNSTIESPIAVSGRSGYASASTAVTVNIIHTYQGDLKVDLVAPNGALYNLHNRVGASTDNIQTTYTLNLSAQPLNGTWKLRVYDGAAGDTGYLQNWSIRF